MQFLQRIRNIGQNPHRTDEENSIVKMVNDALIICILFTALDTISSIITGKHDTAAFTFLFSCLFIFTILLHHFKKYVLAKVCVIILLGVLLVIQAYLFGDTVDITNIFIVLIVFVIVVFEKDIPAILILSLYILGAFFLKNWIVKNVDHPLANQGMIYAKEVYFILSLVLVSVLILRVLKRKDNYINLSNSLLTDVEQKNSALEESNDRLKSFAYATSHDLKTPLRNVSSYIELVAKRIANTDDEKLKEYLAMSRKGIGAMNHSIDDILTLSSLDFNSEQWKDIQLNEILNDLKFNYQASISDGTIKIIADNLPSIKGNKGQLLVLFQNLIDNSIKYNVNDIVEITISERKEADKIILILEDNGIGINPEYSNYIFEPFKRLHSNSKYQGTGLGLAIVKKIMDSHNGSIALLNPNEKTGSRFELIFHDQA